MAERMGRVGRGGGGSEAPDEPGTDPGARGDRARGRGLASLLALAVSGLILYLAWWVLWERSHPAASAARGVRQADAAGRLAAIRELAEIGAQDPDVAVPALILGLSDSQPANRAAAADGLAAAIPGGGAVGPAPEQVQDALTALLGRFGDPEAGVRARAVYALSAIVQSWHGSSTAVDLAALEAETTRLVESPDAVVRSAAVQGLAALSQGGSESPPPRLIAALDDRSEAVRNAAAQGLARFHIPMIRLLPSLVSAMMKARPECRPAYLGVLRRSRPSEYPREIAAEMIPALISALGTRDRQVRAEAATMLGEFGPDARAGIPALLAILDDPREPGLPGPGNDGFSRSRDPAVAAAEALRRIAGDDRTARDSHRSPPAREVVDALIRLAGSPAAGRRLAAVYALTSFEADDAVVAALIAAAGDRDDWVRVAALQALKGRGHRLAPRAIEAIRQGLEARSPPVRYAAATALSGIGPGVEPIVPALLGNARDDPDPSVRDASARALGSLGPPAVSPSVVPRYLEALERPGVPAALRENLIGALIPFGPEARTAVPAIARTLRSAEQEAGRDQAPRGESNLGGMSGLGSLPGPRSTFEIHVALRRNAARALGALAPGTPSAGDAVAALIAAIDDPVDEVNEQVGESLAAFGPAARSAVPALLEALRKARDGKDRPRAARMAESIGRIEPTAPAAGEAVAFLEQILWSDDVLARLFAERVLVVFGPAAAPAVPALVMLARRGSIRASPELSSVATALGRIAPGTPGAGPALDALLTLVRAHPEVPGIETVIDALARFGGGASAALPRLRELAKSGAPPVAAAARRAVNAIGTGPAGGEVVR